MMWFESNFDGIKKEIFSFYLIVSFINVMLLLYYIVIAIVLFLAIVFYFSFWNMTGCVFPNTFVKEYDVMFISISLLFLDHVSCNHRCTNKNICGHQCCKNGKVKKTTQQQQNIPKLNSAVSSFVRELKHRSVDFPNASVAKRMKVWLVSNEVLQAVIGLYLLYSVL